MLILFYLYIISIFFDPNYSFSNSISRMLIAIIAFIFFITKQKKMIRISKGVKYLFLLWLTFLLSYLFKGGDIKILLLFAEEIFVYFLALQLFNDDQTSLKILKVICNIGMILSLLGILEYFEPTKITPFLSLFRTQEIGWYIENEKLRVSATFINPIYLAFMMIITFIISQSISIYQKKLRIYYSLIAMASLITLILTKSDGAIISFLVIESAFICVYRRMKISTIIWIVSIGILAIILYIFLGLYMNIVNVDGLVEIFTKRVYAWIVSLRMLNNDILFGNGLGNYNKFFMDFGHEFIRSYYFKTYSQHSDLFYVSTSAGIFALAIFVQLTAYLLKIVSSLFAKTSRANYQNNIILWISSLSIFYFSLHRLVDDFFINYRTITIFYIICAIFENYYYRQKQRFLLKP